MQLIDWRLQCPGGADGLAADLRSGNSRADADGVFACDKPARPGSIPFGRWRRMTRLTKLMATALTELRAAHPDEDWASMPVLLGSMMGEVVPSSAVLDRWFGEGAQTVSPTNFQNSVYNSTQAHLAIQFGLRGPSETICAGLCTGLATLARAEDWLDTVPRVLILAGEDSNPVTRRAWSHGPGKPADHALAMLVGRGPGLTIRWGTHPGPAPHFARGVVAPYEAPSPDVDAPVHDASRTLGVGGTTDLAALCALGEGSVTSHDGHAAWTAAWE